MNALVNSLWFIVHRVKRRLGFTLIELLIVISLLGIAATLVSTAYLSFERRERVKSAALELKSQIRAAQNKALSGDKGFGSDPNTRCSGSEELIGWYAAIGDNSSSYEIIGNCSADDREFGKKTVYLPKGVEIVDVKYNDAPPIAVSQVYILFRPLDNDVKFFSDTDFTSLNNKGEAVNNKDKMLGAPFPFEVDQASITVTVEDSSENKYEVEILPTGEVSEKKI